MLIAADGPSFVFALAVVLPLALGAGSFLGGLFGGGRRGSTTRSRTQEPEDFGPLRQQLLQNALTRLRSSGLPEGFEARGLQSINDTFAPIQQSIEADVTRRGLGSSPLGAAAARDVNLARGAEAAQFRANLPMLAEEGRRRDFLDALGLFSRRMPGRVQETEVSGAGGIGGGIEGLASMLGFLFGTGRLGQGSNLLGGGG